MKIGPLDSLPAASPVATERRASAAANAHGDTEGLRVELVSRQLLAGEPAAGQRPALALQIHRLGANTSDALQSRNCLEIPVDRKHLLPLPRQPAGMTTTSAGKIKHLAGCRNSRCVVHDPCGRR